MAYHNLNEKNIPLTSYPDVPIASPRYTQQPPVMGPPVGQQPMYAQSPHSEHPPTAYSPYPPNAPVYAQPVPAEQQYNPSYQPVYIPASPVAQPAPNAPMNYADLKTAIRARSAHLSCGRYIKQAHHFGQKNFCKLIAAFILWSLIGWGINAGINALSGRHSKHHGWNEDWEGHPTPFVSACNEQRKQDELDCNGKMGCFITKCEDDGSYVAIQKHELQCWCVDEVGLKLDGTTDSCLVFDTDCDSLRSTQAVLSVCEARRKQETEACGGRMGCFISQCEEDGTFSYKQKHSSTGSCWCVDPKGAELNGTRAICDSDTVCSGPAYEWTNMIPSDVDTTSLKQFVLWGFLHVLATIFLWSPMLAGFYYAVFNAIKFNTAIRFRDFFSCFNCRYYCKLLGLSFVMQLSEAFLFLLILPGIWWALATLFAIPLHKEHPFLGVCGSIRLSMMVIHSHFCAMIGFLLLLALLQIAGFLCFIVGLLYTGPLAFIALCYCYHDLVGIVTEAPFAGPVDMPVTVHV